ncbi:hypothetical protein D3C75_658980 [compost metagenome]
MELDQDFADNPHLRLHGLHHRKLNEFADDFTGQPFVFAERKGRKAGLAAVHPFAEQGLCASWNHLIRSEPVQQAHHQVAIAGGCNQPVSQLQADPEARLVLHSGGIQRNHRNLPQTRVLQRLAQQGDIIGCPAASPGLRHDDSRPVRIIISALQG